jgi:hypothetical protein
MARCHGGAGRCRADRLGLLLEGPELRGGKTLTLTAPLVFSSMVFASRAACCPAMLLGAFMWA